MAYTVLVLRKPIVVVVEDLLKVTVRRIGRPRVTRFAKAHRTRGCIGEHPASRTCSSVGAEPRLAHIDGRGRLGAGREGAEPKMVAVGMA